VFVGEVAASILPSWAPIAARRRGVPLLETERRWQLERRGRYVEFNLLHDRRVRFGLAGGRIESVMVSAPPLVAWRYGPAGPAAGSEEEALVAALRTPRAWV
jgi:coproporphyrinogen III oxidase